MAASISVIVFPGVQLPLWTGIERQFFKSEGLAGNS
jgi:hypothetical protein